MPTLYDHQNTMASFALNHDVVLNTSDPGTGKTAGTLAGYLLRRQEGRAQRALVVAPLSILRPSWAADIDTFSERTWSIAHGSEAKRLSAFEHSSDFVIINHDGVKWLSKNMHLLEGFTDLIIDEFTAFKNRTAQRSKAMLKIRTKFDHVTALSGTPNSNNITDIWFPMFLLDRGERLGQRFFKFRQETQFAEQVGPRPEHVRWVDKPGANDQVAMAVADVSLRFRFEDCLDIPPNKLNFMEVPVPAKVMRAYKSMEKDNVRRNSHPP